MTNPINFNGRVAIVTGAGRGIGKVYAVELAKRGASVVVNDLGVGREGQQEDLTPAQQVVQEIQEAGGKAIENTDSVSEKTGAESLIQSAIDAFGKVDILINNAGILRDKSLMKMQEEDWDSVYAVHLKGAFNVTQAAFRNMKENGYGRIVNTASGAGLYGNFGQANYMSAKTGLIGLMNSVSIEGQKHNIKCNLIAPLAASRMSEGLFPPEVFDKLKPELLSPLVMYLVSEENSETKKIFNCAGGWFSRTEILCAPGIILEPENGEISAEAIRDNWDKVMSLEGAKPMRHAGDCNEFMASLFT